MATISRTLSSMPPASASCGTIATRRARARRQGVQVVAVEQDAARGRAQVP